MNKTAVKNFAIWARNKLITDLRYKAGLMGITEKGIDYPLPQSTQSVQFFDIGTKEPYAISGIEIEQRRKLADLIKNKSEESDYNTALKYVIEEVAYTWFNRLIAIRFMEVNDYLPTRVRVLSSESDNKMEPDLVTHALDVELNYSNSERERIAQLKFDSKLDDLFRMLFIKQCNALNVNLPELFEKTSDFTELLLNVSFTDKEGVVYHLVNDILEDDFNVSKEGQIEIIGWLYQYYNTEPKDETFALVKKNVKITKERIPAATQLFTPAWIVKYMVENSLGRLWVEGHPNEELKATWKYYLEEVAQEEEAQRQLEKILEEYKTLKPKDIKVIDPAMGSGHILVYAFDVLMQIYDTAGYTRRDAARSIVENNLYGLDIDNRAYQLAYFAVMMKARQYNRRILNGETICHVYAIQESNDINRNQLKYFGAGLSNMEKNVALLQMQGLMDTFTDAKEYGSIINVENYNWELLRDFIKVIDADGQMSLDSIGVEYTRNKLRLLVETGEIMALKYDVVVTNPPYMGSGGMCGKLSEYVKKKYPDSKADLFAVFIEKCNTMTKLNRYQAMITQHAFMFLSSFEKLRSKILLNDFVNMAHLGARAFDEIGGEVVQTTSFVMRQSHVLQYKGLYVRLTEPTTQIGKEEIFLLGQNRYETNQNNFSRIPGSPIAYWVSNSILSIYPISKPLGEIAAPRKGNSTSDNNRFLRLWYEVSTEKINLHAREIIREDSIMKRWYPYNKGGGYRKWYGFNEYLVDWYNDAEEIRNIKTAVIANYQYFMKPGLTWSTVSSKKFSIRWFEEGYIFDNGGCCIFELGDNRSYLLALLNSIVFEYIFGQLNPTLNFQSGEVAKFPVLIANDENIKVLASKNVLISKSDWDAFETSWDFQKHPFLKGNTIKNGFVNWQSECKSRFDQLKQNEEELNRIFITIYGLKDELFPELDDKDVTVSKDDLTRDIKSFISYAVGCVFGRYSLGLDGVAYAGGEWDGKKYNMFIPDKDNILPITDEEYLQDDIVGLFTKFVKKVYGEETIEENLDFIADALGKNGNNSREVIRNYFSKDFFDDHCRVYQKRPIYWLFDSGKQNGFKALVYMHRYDENTIGNLRIDYLHRMQRIYENEIARMQDTIVNSKDSREVAAVEKRKEKLIKQLQETKEYDEKIAHLALARISIDLDDGVKVNYEKVQTDKGGKKLDVLAKI